MNPGTKKIFIIVISLLTICMSIYCQSIQKVDSTDSVKKAVYLKGDLQKVLSALVKYPDAGLLNNKQGDVVISFRINRAGKSDSMALVTSPDVSLSTSSIVALNSLEDNWTPAMRNNLPADRKYLVVFRYRIYTDNKPADYKRSAGKYVKKQKFEKALQHYDLAIKDNPFDSDLFASRSKVKEILGDTIGAKSDLLTSLKLKTEMMSVIDVSAFGLSSADRKPVVTERVIRTEIIAK
jgi:tetratricopeptide (TPR) repeat protein